MGVAQELLGGGQSLALHLEAAQGVHRLRREADVAHDRDVVFRQPGD